MENLFETLAKITKPCPENSDNPAYVKIDEIDVIKLIIHTTNCMAGGEVISPSNIASLLRTSRYQVDKHIKVLKNKGFISYQSVLCTTDEDYCPPYNGYKLSESGKIEYGKEIKEHSDWECQIIKECFGE